MESPFDHILRKQRYQHQTRLPFAELCGFYAALMDGISPAIVSRASGLAVATVASLRAAGQIHAGQLRYPKIANEYRALGREAFAQKYATYWIMHRLEEATDHAVKELAAPKRFEGVNPRADSHAGHHSYLNKRTGLQVEFDIGLTETPFPGWSWRDKHFGGPVHPDGRMWRGDPRHEERRFARSKDAHDFYLLRAMPTERQDSDSEAANDDSYFYALNERDKYYK